MYYVCVISLFFFLVRGIRLIYIFIILNFICLYVLFIKYQFWFEKKIMGKMKCRWFFKFLLDGILRNVGNYMVGGKIYCMKKLKYNYYVYEF